MDYPIKHDDLADAVGLWCPEPLMVLRRHLRLLMPGQVLLIKSTDPSTERDFADFCRFLKHEMLDTRCDQGAYLYWIRKGETAG